MRATTLVLLLTASLPGCPSAPIEDAGSADGGDTDAPVPLDAPALDAPTPALDAPTPALDAPVDAPARLDTPALDAPTADVPAPMPSVAIGDVRLTEGTDTNPIAHMPITFSMPTPLDVTLTFAIVDGSAQVDSDVVAPVDLTLVVPRGTTSASFDVEVRGDRFDELDEECTVTLATTELAITRGAAILTIVDDDEATFRVAAPGPSDVLSVSEGTSAAPGSARVTVARAAAPRGGTVRVRTVPVTASASDFVAVDRTLSFTAGGAMSFEVVVDLVGDATGETDETFRIEISEPSGGVIGPSDSVLVTITDDDPPEISGCASRSITEGDTGRIRFDFVLSSNIPAPPGVRALFTIGGTASRSVDYELVGFSTMTSGVDFPVGATSAVVSIDVINDTAVEINETVTLTLIGTSGTAGATLSPTCTLSTLTIVEDDPF